MIINPAQERALAKIRRGEALSEDDKAATISSRDELDAYLKGLSDRGRLTSEALAAIIKRQGELGRG